jgi:hypothetical protein
MTGRPRELVLPGQLEALAPHGQQEDGVRRVDLEQAADAPDVAMRRIRSSPTRPS